MIASLRRTEFANITYKYSSLEVPTEKEIDEAIKVLLSKKPFITVADFRHHLNLSSTYAYRVTRQLAEAGKLRNVDTGRTKIYVRGEAMEE
ncbi:hypothetical protein [Prevotella nigrescens]|uniref:hypothetical protein n=1 Tax=Prevotella nigrescens TaxID=28133 RepID=UPI0027E3FC51|nr:hypothetical protein [Prevotella nigrescens]